MPLADPATRDGEGGGAQLEQIAMEVWSELAQLDASGE
jgi:hypothetical protein